MPRQKRESHKTPLAKFLRQILKEHEVSILQAARIAGCAPSVLHGWLQGSYPSETIDKLKRLANHFGYSLAVAMSGEPDEIKNTFDIRQQRQRWQGKRRELQGFLRAQKAIQKNGDLDS